MKITGIESRSHPGVVYEITFDADDTPRCTCPGFAYGQDCVHATAARMFWAMLRDGKTVWKPSRVIGYGVVIPGIDSPARRALTTREPNCTDSKQEIRGDNHA